MLAAVVAAGGACERSRGTPTIKPLPEPDIIAARHAAEPQSPRIANYRIDAVFDAETMAIDATSELTWRNAGASPVESLPLHLYMNAFKSEDTVFMRESLGQHRRAKANFDRAGWIDVASISIDHGPNLRERATFPAGDETVLTVPLDRALASGESVTVKMEFHVQLPQVFARTGYKGAFAMVGQWFPKIGVRTGPAGGERWHCEPFHVQSEFFADFGVYDVSLTVPETYVIAATGVLTGVEDLGNGRRTLRYHAEDVHDFAWMADPYMEVLAGTATTAAGPVEVLVYHRPEQRAFAERHLRAGIGSIEVYSEMLVPYPWTRMTIITPPPNAADGAGGMEYPTLVTTAGDFAFAFDGVLLPETVTIHEVGHNWFQGIVASNEVDEAWLDEGVNEYLNGVVLERIYGTPNQLAWDGWSGDYYRMRQALLHWPATPIATASYAFPTMLEYGSATYSKTALALRTLENLVGRERFLAALGAFARTWAFRHPTGADFFAALEQHLGEDLDWFVTPAFYGAGATDFRVENVACHRERCEVLVANRGAVRVPVDIDVRFDDGHIETAHWDGAEPWRELVFERDAEVTAVDIDPDHRIVLDETPWANAWRRANDRGPSRRAGARAQSWTQTLMQVTGL
jgi:hypothetical protein